ncbi:PRC-barrel domain-containing protein [Candidatus Mancarchaeum acidiphilum]|uniref:PRC-barrel domain-containing protein n=1 Tax=Candidatus Mancarchaeum acidiphilum TaxID=1920749 RepID=A0A218NM81_9ARCH|nr:PRC-barrel domain-containing protein [Candidatus Mancarchaeum acidiphilum]ASI13563.1 PRC-barrel domain-containing protein [Candidatus Mancarchaeum acidiphilum]
MKLSDVYDMDVYSDGGQFLGNVKDAIVDLEHGEVGRLLMIGWSNVSEDNIQAILKDKSVLFKNIKNIGDVVLVSTSKKDSEEASAESSDLSFK